jgi:hypothetical protein
MILGGIITASTGVGEVILGFIDPKEAPKIPTPYLSTMVVIAATRGDLEAGQWWNDVTGVLEFGGTVGLFWRQAEKFTDTELLSMLWKAGETGSKLPDMWEKAPWINNKYCPAPWK